MHPEKKAIKIIQSWKMLGHLDAHNTEAYSSQKGTPGKLVGQLLLWDSLVFLFFSGKENF